MNIAFISDLHITPEQPEILLRLSRFLESQRGKLDALYVLGDLFEYWIGDDASEHIDQIQTERILRDFTQNGCPVFVMRGNRDFLLGPEFAYRCGCTLIDDPYEINLCGERALLMHGDSLCTDDVEHQKFRLLVRSSTWQQAFLAKNIEQRDAIARQLRYRSEAGKQTKSTDIMDVNAETVVQTMSEHNVCLLIHGHTHRPAIHDLAVNGRTARRVVLGDWYEQSSVLFATGKGLKLTSQGQASGIGIDLG